MMVFVLQTGSGKEIALKCLKSWSRIQWKRMRAQLEVCHYFAQRPLSSTYKQWQEEDCLSPNLCHISVNTVSCVRKRRMGWEQIGKNGVTWQQSALWYWYLGRNFFHFVADACKQGIPSSWKNPCASPKIFHSNVLLYKLISRGVKKSSLYWFYVYSIF